MVRRGIRERGGGGGGSQGKDGDAIFQKQSSVQKAPLRGKNED